MCGCKNIIIGYHDNQSSLHTPEGKLVDIDNCILDEIKELWDFGITTYESCCGHNLVKGYISVDDKSIWKMVALGYKPYCGIFGKRKDMFLSKTV